MENTTQKADNKRESTVVWWPTFDDERAEWPEDYDRLAEVDEFELEKVVEVLNAENWLELLDEGKTGVFVPHARPEIEPGYVVIRSDGSVFRYLGDNSWEEVNRERVTAELKMPNRF